MFSVKGHIIKISLSFILLATLIAGCDGVSRQQSNSGEQPSTESVESKMSQAAEVNKVEPLEPDVVFPHIKPVYRAFNLQLIEAYCRKRGIQQLDRDCVRLICQPMGFVAEAIEIDLIHRQLTVYPGTYSKNVIVQTSLDEEQTAEIRELVTSEEFQEIPTENEKIGMDGISYLVEVSTDNVYFWKLHWLPEDKEFMKVVDHIRSLAREKNAQQNAPPPSDKPRRWVLMLDT